MKYFILLIVLSFPLKASSQLAMPIDPAGQNKDWWVWTYFDNDTTTGSTSNFKCSNYAYDTWPALVFVLKTFNSWIQGYRYLLLLTDKLFPLVTGILTERNDLIPAEGAILFGFNTIPTLYTFYSNLRNHSLKVKNGDVVKKGDTIAYVGSSGNVYFAKLYFRVEGSNGGNFLDPLGYQCGSPPYPAILKPGPVYDTTFGLLDFALLIMRNIPTIH